MRTTFNLSPETDSHYHLVARALEYLDANQRAQPSAVQLARFLDVSEGFLQRTFRDWVGLTPKQYLQTLTVDSAKACLEASQSVMDSAYSSGLSGPGRLHDHFVTVEAMTPGEYRSLGEQLHISYGYAASPFGRSFVAFTERGICQLGFAGEPFGEDGLARLQANWPLAKLHHDDEAVSALMAPIWSAWNTAQATKIRLLVKGSNFQIQVWRALLAIPQGSVVDYANVAQHIERPTAVRAVASAIGANPVACLIPCHRVIRKDGSLGGYRWGLPRKQMLLAREFSSP